MTGKPVVIQALLFKPEGADSRRLPAVVALHGCGVQFLPCWKERGEGLWMIALPSYAAFFIAR